MSIARGTSVTAVISLVCGILGWTLLPFIGNIVAIITGHMARAEIRRQPERLEGDAMALTGLILGWLGVSLWILAGVTFLLFFGGLAWLVHAQS
jgi:hypothetical protein